MPQLTEHFRVDELACRCGCGLVPPFEFLGALERLREAYAEPMRISSGARCPEYNARVSRTGRNGPHTIGAVDVLVSGELVFELLSKAIRHGWTGLGIAQHGPHRGRFVHLDRLPAGGAHPRPRVWSYA